MCAQDMLMHSESAGLSSGAFRGLTTSYIITWARCTRFMGYKDLSVTQLALCLLVSLSFCLSQPVYLFLSLSSRLTQALTPLLFPSPPNDPPLYQIWCLAVIIILTGETTKGPLSLLHKEWTRGREVGQTFSMMLFTISSSSH